MHYMVDIDGHLREDIFYTTSRTNSPTMPKLRRVSYIYSSGHAQRPRAPHDTARRRARSPNHTMRYSFLDQEEQKKSGRPTGN